MVLVGDDVFGEELGSIEGQYSRDRRRTTNELNYRTTTLNTAVR